MEAARTFVPTSELTTEARLAFCCSSWARQAAMLSGDRSLSRTRRTCVVVMSTCVRPWTCGRQRFRRIERTDIERMERAFQERYRQPTSGWGGRVANAQVYEFGEPFPGVIGRTIEESVPAWPERRRAPAGAPNVVWVILDDVGFAQLGCFGAPIHTPNMDALAQRGLRFSNMHATALCSPTRACLMTGRNHHANGLGVVPEMGLGFPGYNGTVPRENGMLPEILREHGYTTLAVGKWHLAPITELSAVGPFDSWPLARGF